MDIFVNFLMFSGVALMNMLLCLGMFFSAFKAWMWLNDQLRMNSEMTSLRIDLLSRKIGELEKKHGSV
jgi:hypothetical protein